MDTPNTPQVAVWAEDWQNFPALPQNPFFSASENLDVSDIESDFIAFARYDQPRAVPGTIPEERAEYLADGQTPEEIEADIEAYRAARRAYIERMKAFIAVVEQDDKDAEKPA